MKRTRLSDRSLPDYTRGEEIFNMVSHIVGGGIGIATTVLCVIVAVLHNNIYGVVSGAIFGGTMILLYTMSSLYHGLPADKTAKKVFQVFDHCSIFLLIAGSYTPIALSSMREYSPALGWTVFGVIWAVALVGITANAIDLKKYARFSMICYLGMGWCIFFTFGKMIKIFEPGGLVLLIAGGVAYTAGAVLYGIGKKRRYMHSLFHCFVLAGSVLHVLFVLFYIM
ncbi:MAG: hemolysin III family protein [Oscillospiraceae bacterium]